MEHKYLENDFIKMTIDKGILIGDYKSGVTIDIDAAKKIVDDRKVLCSGVDYPTLGLIEGIKTVTKEARDFLGKEEGIVFMKSLAILVGSPISKTIGNFFLLINKPAIPTRLFTNRDEACQWLANYI